MKRKIMMKFSFIDLTFIFFFCYDLFIVIINYFMNNYDLSTKICTILLYLFLIIGLIKERKALKIDSILLISGIYLLFLLNMVMYSDYRYAFTSLKTWNMYTSIFTFYDAIFAYLFFRLINDYKRMFKDLQISSILLFIWAVLRIIFAMKNGGFSKMFEFGITSTANYDMSVGYRLLFSSIIFFMSYKTNSNKILLKYLCLTLSIISIILMIIYGPRSSSISFVFFIICFWLFDKQKSNKKLFKKILLIGFALGLYLFLTNNNNIQLFYNFLDSHNINSRIISTFREGTLSLDFGRNKLWVQTIKLIKLHPIIGNGIFFDRHYYGIYCHQFVLELFGDFGIILGSCIIMLIIKGIINIMGNDNNWKTIFLIFFSSVFIRLNVSSSFWQDTNFWACIAIYINYRCDKKKGIKNE